MCVKDPRDKKEWQACKNMLLNRPGKRADSLDPALVGIGELENSQSDPTAQRVPKGINVPAKPSRLHLHAKKSSHNTTRRRDGDAPHPWFLAVSKHEANSEGSIYPLLASAVVPGFPIISFDPSTPFAIIWNSAVSGHVDDEAVRSPSQVVYSEVPSALALTITLRQR